MNDTESDIESMESITESGWSFNRILIGDIRRVYRTPANELRFGRWKGLKLKFADLLKPMFHRSVFDPSRFARNQHDADNLCAVMGLMMTVYIRLQKGGLRSISIDKFWQDLAILNFQNILPWGVKGFSFKDLDTFEKQNSPIPKSFVRLFKPLSFFKGFAINIFRVVYQSGVYRIFPVSLSKNHRDSSYFQIDLLQVTQAILHESVGTLSTQHLLAIPRLARMLTKFTGLRLNWWRCNWICKACLQLFTCADALMRHYLTCDPSCRRAGAARKAGKNVFRHRPYRFNSFSQRLEKNGLTWKRSDNWRLLKPFCMICADFEAYNTDLDEDTRGAYNKIPSNAIKVQPPMSYAYTIKGLYENIPLPDNLSMPRVKVCAQTDTSNTQTLILALFLSLRQDLVSIGKFLHSILSTDRPPASVGHRDIKTATYVASRLYCAICGLRFGRRMWSEVTKSFYTVKRVYDHDHLSSAMNYPALQSGIRAVTCQGSYLFPSILYVQ